MKKEEEIWKDIPGYEGQYQASTKGRIKSLFRIVPHSLKGQKTIPEIVLKQSNDGSGYPTVHLSTKTFRVHKIMEMTFMDKGIFRITHKDGNYENNEISNLIQIVIVRGTSRECPQCKNTFVITDEFRIYCSKKCYTETQRTLTDIERINRTKARSIFNNYIRDNKVERGSCLICDKPEAEAHHTDYSKPLQVVWLCTIHHRQIHNGNLY